MPELSKKNEKMFYSAMQRIFVGAPVEGEGGFINLLKIKCEYYNKILERFKSEVQKNTTIIEFKEDFFERLYTFFEKYFSENGSVFYTQTTNWPKIYEEVYTDTRDVVLFWKTNMLYYVKSDKMLKSTDIYVPVSSDEEAEIKHFYFDVSELKNKQNNTIDNLLFSYSKFETDEINGVYFIKVENTSNGKKTNIDTIKKEIKSDGAPVVSEEIIKKAIDIFEKQITVDYFINKNAGAFLKEQLDLYLHQILLETDSAFDEKRLTQLKTVKEFANKLIDFISQFEDELVRVWNKPKFVKNSNYVITLDKICDEITDKISAAPGLAGQIKEWKMLKMVSDDFDFSSRTNEHSKLPVDTRYFKELEFDILGQFENLDEALDGYLIKSENYQALNTISKRYKEKVQCIYIDPPFKTGKDFGYIDNYLDSTWLTIMKDRLDLADKFMANDGTLYLHLDYRANYLGRILLNNYYDKDNIPNEIIWRFGWVSGYKAGNPDIFLRNHQTIFRCTKVNSIFNSHKSTIKYETIKPSEKQNELSNFLKSLEIDEKCINWDLSKFTLHKKDGRLIKFDKNRPAGYNGKYPYEDVWNTGDYDTLDSIMIKSYTKEKVEKAQELTQKPEALLQRIIEISSNENRYIMDFFAGSGTTARAAIKLNRKFICVEMGEHYDDTIIPSLKEALYPKSLREPTGITKTVNWQGGGFFKYYELEQYEDTLSKMSYKDKTPSDIYNTANAYAGYIFLADGKLLDNVVSNSDIDSMNFENLYGNIDFPETISHIYGLPIKKITPATVTLNKGDHEECVNYDYKNMTKEEKLEFLRLLRPYLWWGM